MLYRVGSEQCACIWCAYTKAIRVLGQARGVRLQEYGDTSSGPDRSGTGGTCGADRGDVPPGLCSERCLSQCDGGPVHPGIRLSDFGAGLRGQQLFRHEIPALQQ